MSVSLSNDVEAVLLLVEVNLIEHLVEEAVVAARAAAANGARPVRMLEIGTGTGCISTCVAAGLRGQRRGTEPTDPPVLPIDIQIVATDLVPAALELARTNAAAHGVTDAIEFRAGSIYEPLTAAEQGIFHVLVSNPPYVRDDEWQEMNANVRDHEPRTALAGGAAVVWAPAEAAPKTTRAASKKGR